MTGIYLIQSPSKNIYIGQSIDIEKRWHEYKKLNNCKGQTKLYRSFKKYGVENHKFYVAYECEEKDLNKEERFYQDCFDVLGQYGLNCRLTETDNKSGKLSNEHKQKISEANKGQKRSNESRKKMSESRKGRKQPKFTHKGIKHSEATKQKMSDAKQGKKNNRFGKKHSLETKLKMSEARKGIKYSEDTIKKMRESHKGKILPEEQKQKMSEAAKLRWKNKKNDKI